MAKVTYWLSACLDDSTVYNLRAKTRKALNVLLDERGREGYGKPRKVTLEYADTLDLLNQVLGEGGVFAEYSAEDHDE